jgi:hypothetical protein
VNGNVIELKGQTKTITPTSSQQVVTPDSGYNGLTEVRINAIPSPMLQNKSVEITENGTTNVTPDTGYDGLSSVAITANVQTPSEYNAKMMTPFIGGSINSSRCKALTYLKDLGTIDMSVFKGSYKSYANDFFAECYNLKSVTLTNTSNMTYVANMFFNCWELENAPLFDTTGATNMSTMFSGCSKLKNVPIYITSAATNMQNMFLNCTMLTSESLNNIMQMCINTTSAYTKTKTLRYLGLSSAQATTCQSLSNWDAFVAAGWTSGY